MDVDELTKELSILSKPRRWQFIAEPDGRCCTQCHILNGKIFSDGDPFIPKLPLHPNCRCRLVEIAPSEAMRDAQKQKDSVTATGFSTNARYIKNGSVYDTDEQGRVKEATAELQDAPGKRNRRNQETAAQMGNPGDEGGHLIPARYGGSGDLINHLPQSRTANRSLIKKIENEMGKALREGKKVEYTVTPHYPDFQTLRPDKFKIRYKIDGVEKTRSIPND